MATTETSKLSVPFCMILQENRVLNEGKSANIIATEKVTSPPKIRSTTFGLVDSFTRVYAEMIKYFV